MATHRTEPITRAEIMQVHRFECRMNGHSFDVVRVLDDPNPKLVVCTHCGEQWPVMRREQGAT